MAPGLELQEAPVVVREQSYSPSVQEEAVEERIPLSDIRQIGAELFALSNQAQDTAFTLRALSSFASQEGMSQLIFDKRIAKVKRQMKALLARI